MERSGFGYSEPYRRSCTGTLLPMSTDFKRLRVDQRRAIAASDDRLARLKSIRCTMLEVSELLPGGKCRSVAALDQLIAEELRHQWDLYEVSY